MFKIRVARQFARRLTMTTVVCISCSYSMAATETKITTLPGNIAENLSDEELAYRKAIVARAEKIVATLELADAEQAGRVVRIVADQYRHLRDIHDKRDHDLQAIPDEGLNDRAETRDDIIAASERGIIALHRTYIAQLAAEIDADQVDQVKDGMTYGVVAITYNAYLELLPELTAPQKTYIKANLLEAREYAMDAGSSGKKHAWFGKYKGRINNFLSRAGYDLKQAERDLANRKRG